MYIKHFKCVVVSISLFLLTNTFNNCIIAKELDYSQIKEDSYRALAQAFYNKNTYSKFRIEIIDTLGKLSDKTDTSYNEDSFENTMIYKTLKSMLAAVTENMNQKRTTDGLSDNVLTKKIDDILTKGDAAIAYILEDALKDKDYTVQLYAASSIMKVNEKTAYPLFLKMLDSTKQQEQIASLTVLGNIQSTESIPKIVSLLENPDTSLNVKMSALRALEKIDTKKATEVSLTLLNSPEQTLKTEAAVFLTLQHSPEGFSAYEDMLNNQNTKKSVVIYLPKISESLQGDTLPLITKLLDSEEDFKKIYAITALEKIENRDIVWDLLEKAVSSDNVQIKFTAYKTLAEIDNEKAISLLEQVTFDKPEFYNKAAEILIKSKNPSNKKVLEKFLDLDNDNLKIMVSEYFLSHNTNKETAQKTLIDLLHNKNEQIQYSAAILLAENNFEDGKDVINSMLESDNPVYKARAVIALATVGNKTVVPYLKESMKNSNDFRKTYGAALILYNLGEKQYLSVLIKYLSQADIDPIQNKFVNKELFAQLLENPNSRVRLNAANSLFAAGDTTGLNTIKGLLDDPDVLVRSKAAKILGQYGSPEDIEILHKLIDDESVRVRVNSSEAMLRIINRKDKSLRS